MPNEREENDPDIIVLDAEREADEREDATMFARLGMWGVPVVIAHLALIWVFVRAAFGDRLPRLPHSDLVVGWLWVNGAALLLGVWLWRRNRIPLGAGKWLSGRRARWFIVAWLGGSLAWFLLPALIRDALRAVSQLFPSW